MTTDPFHWRADRRNAGHTPMIRRWLFFWAMRSIQKEELQECYRRFRTAQNGGQSRSSRYPKMIGLTCMMRKLMKPYGAV